MGLTIRVGDTVYSNMTPEALAAAGVDAESIRAAEIGEVVSRGHAQIDALCDAAYTASPSRGARYQRKEAEARAYLAAGEPEEPAAAVYPMLVAEATARSLTPAAMAAEIITAADAYTALAAEAEAARARLAAAVAAAADLAEMEAAAAAEVDAVRAALLGMA